MRGIYHGESRNRDLFCSKEYFKCSKIYCFHCCNVVFIVVVCFSFSKLVKGFDPSVKSNKFWNIFSKTMCINHNSVIIMS